MAITLISIGLFLFIIFLYATIEQVVIFPKYEEMRKEFTQNKFSRPPGIGKTIEPDFKFSSHIKWIKYIRNERRKL